MPILTGRYFFCKILKKSFFSYSNVVIFDLSNGMNLSDKSLERAQSESIKISRVYLRNTPKTSWRIKIPRSDQDRTIYCGSYLLAIFKHP